MAMHQCVVCAVAACPYRSDLGFCLNRVTALDQNGRCKHIYNRNGIKENWREPIIDRRFFNDWVEPETKDKIQTDQKDDEQVDSIDEKATE